MDGIQRYTIVGRIGINPIVRGVVAAAVMERNHGALSAGAYEREDFLVAPTGRLDPHVVRDLESAGLTLYDSSGSERSHPVLDVQLAGRVIERRRAALEVQVANKWLARSQGWLLIDGSIADLLSPDQLSSVLGVVKSHETQFLDGSDLTTALTLPAGHRTSVFARESDARVRVYSWYLRLWPWEHHDLLHGLIRLERAPTDTTLAEATEVSRWLLAERAPLSAPDGRWDRLLYPVHQVETYLRSHVGERL